MFERAVMPNEVRDLTNGNGSHNQICVSKASSGGPSPFGFALGRSAQGFGYFCRAAEPALSLSKGAAAEDRQAGCSAHHEVGGGRAVSAHLDAVE